MHPIPLPTRTDLQSTRSFTRVLSHDDVGEFRALRLEALKYDGAFYADSYHTEKNKDPEFWLERCIETDSKCAIGFFCNGKMVGLTEVKKWADDVNGVTAYLRSAYIAPPYRGYGYGHVLHKARLDWASRWYKSAVVLHLARNEVANRITLKNGGIPWRKITATIPDGGGTADAVWYRINLDRRAGLEQDIHAAAN